MAGARTPATRPIRVIPPMITAPTMSAPASPVIQGETPNCVCITSAIVLDWTPFPERKELSPRQTAKKMAIGFQAFPRPSSM